jgi:salicylate hydroxylase
MQTRFAIVGGGPGALAAAHSLLRFGFPNVRVFERAAAYGPAAGAGFGLAFNGAAVLQALGLGPAVLPSLAPVRHWAVLDGERRGALVGQLRDAPDLVAPGGLRDATLSGALRAEVMGALVRALPPGVLRPTRDVVGVRPGGGGLGPASVDFSDGSSEEADVVVAADGIRSRVRDALFGPSAPTYSSYFMASRRPARHMAR